MAAGAALEPPAFDGAGKPLTLALPDYIDAIANLVALNNQFYSGVALSFAMGAATSRQGERLEAVVRRADAAMYVEKRAYYSDSQRDRREAPPSRRRSAASQYRQAPGD